MLPHCSASCVFAHSNRYDAVFVGLQFYLVCSVQCKPMLCGAYIVEQHENFPEDPLPDPDFLRQDLASCVSQGLPECQFIEGEYMVGRHELGHRRQMSQFCGQEHFCGAFNSQRAMITAMVGRVSIVTNNPLVA